MGPPSSKRRPGPVFAAHPGRKGAAEARLWRSGAAARYFLSGTYSSSVA